MPNREQPGSLSEIFTRDFLLLSVINLAMFFGFLDFGWLGHRFAS